MADYWKSQPRHFCEFCKCWTADNKPSRDFHERGKRHQDNVKKKLDELRKKGFEDAKKEKEMSSYLKQMEKGAMKKLKQDLMTDPKLASQYGVVIKNKSKEGADKTDAETDVRKPDKQTVPGNDESPGIDVRKPDKQSEQTIAGIDESPGGWCEATTDEGYVYYWNTVTRETRWEPPTENEETAVSSAAGSAAVVTTMIGPVAPAVDVKKEKHDAEPPAKKCKMSFKKSKRQYGVDRSAPAAQRDAPVSEKKVPAAPIVPMMSTVASDKTVRHSAYGAWEEVKPPVEEPVVDLQLPVVDSSKTTEQKTIIVSSEPKVKFREKTVASLSVGAAVGSDTAVGFRKPKFGARRSIRTTDCSEEN